MSITRYTDAKIVAGSGNSQFILVYVKPVLRKAVLEY